MKASCQRILMVMAVIFVMTLSLFNTGIAFADDQPPVESPGIEDPVAIDIPAATPESISTEEVGAQEILAQIPDEIEVVAFNEEGQSEPLVTQQAVEIMLTSDPMWCPDGQTPGGAGCTAGYATAAELIAVLNGVTGDGTIYFTSTYSTNDLTFDQIFNSNLSGLGALTIQGGWNGSSGNAFALSGSTLFSGVGITITHWNGSITLSNVVVDGAIGDGITIYYTNSNIQLTNVSSNNNSNDGFYIESNGEITATNIAANDNGFAGAVLFGGDGVTLNGTNTFNDNDNSYGLGVFSYTDIVLNNIIASSNNGGAGVYIDNTAGSGDVALNGSNTFNENMEGLFILSNGDITANNIEASNNAGNGAYVDNNLYGGNGNVVISGINIFNGNGQSGVNVVSNGNITIENVMANENDVSGIRLTGYGSPVTVSSSVFNSNGHYGIDAEYVSASMLLDNVSFDCLNGLGDYIYGNIVFRSCPPEVENLKDRETLNGAFHIVFMHNNESIDLDCRQYTGTMFILDTGNRAILKCPITGVGSLNVLGNESLPGFLPEDVEYVYGMQVIQSGGENDKVLNGEVIISFLIPQDIKDANFSVLYWDGSSWVNLSSTSFEDGRKIFNGGHFTGEGYFEAITNFSGIFVLVKK